MIILGIETTCDETGVGIVKNGRDVLSNVVSSSAVLHKKYRGVVPEVAAREQVKVIIPALSEALRISNLDFSAVDAVAVSYGPGLVGSLLIGTETAKVLALTQGKPLIAVNHLIGHIYANWLTVIGSQFMEKPGFPLVALIVSGGHTDLVLMTGHGKFKWLGGTRDDAAGEVFDKVARVLGLGYPGGPEIEKVASPRQRRVRLWRKSQSGKSESNKRFPRPMISEDNFDFSFSGLKTAVVNRVKSLELRKRGSELSVAEKHEIAFEFQCAVVDVLVAKTVKAAAKFGARSIVVGGGVAANAHLRSLFAVHCSRLDIPLFFPPIELSVDNGAMVAAAAYFQKDPIDPLKLQADPSLHFDSV